MSDNAPHTPSGSIGDSSVDPHSVEGIFVAALNLEKAAERETFLAEACGEDRALRLRVDALLRAYEDAGSFLDKPPEGLPTTIESQSFDFLQPSDDPGLLGTLGPYEIYEVIGRGGMGIVFRARDPKLNRVVAVKVLAPELAANPNARRRFIREAQAGAAISHPHVVTIHAVDEDEKLPYLVMECIVGQSLQQKLDNVGALRLTEALRIGKQVAEGLAAAHRQGLIHRDIKPANILLENGVERVKITDFGLARAVDDVSVTRTGEVAGSPQFMSPEQAKGERVDVRSDLFSLGCVMYAMCTGRSPFRATNVAAAIRRVCDDEPRPIEEINPEIPEWFIAIVEKLLDKNPDNRFQSADEVVDLLEAHLAGVQGIATGGRRPVNPPSSTIPRRTPSSAAQPELRATIGFLVSAIGAIVCVGGIVATAVSLFVDIGNESLVLYPVLGIVAGAAMALGGQILSRRRISSGAWLVLLVLMLGPAGLAVWLLKKSDLEAADRNAAAEEATAPAQRFVSQDDDAPPLLDRVSAGLFRLAFIGPVTTLVGFGAWAAVPRAIEGDAARLLIVVVGPVLYAAALIAWCGRHLRNVQWGWESYYKGVAAGVLALLLPPVWIVGIPCGLAALWALNQKSVIDDYHHKGTVGPIRLPVPTVLFDVGTFLGALVTAGAVFAVSAHIDHNFSGADVMEGAMFCFGLTALLLPFRGSLFRGRWVRDAAICTAGFVLAGLIAWGLAS